MLPLNATAISRSFKLDLTPPTAGVVSLFCDSTFLGFVGESHYLEGCWDGFTDSESGIDKYEVAVGAVDIPETDHRFSPVGCVVDNEDSSCAISSFSFYSLQLAHGIEVALFVKATNRAGLSTISHSDVLKGMYYFGALVISCS